jgi:hypothetical protein
MKTAVETVFVGKNRLFNRRFMQMCSHYLIEPVACTPAAGWEKGQVENRVGLARERFFTPRLRFKSYDEMNAWLLDQCVLYAKAHRHPEIADKTIWDVFEEERQKLVPYRGRFDGFHEVQASVSKTCLVRFDNNKYSVNASAIGCPVDIRAYADRVIIRQDGRVVADHPRAFGRRATIYDPWHYVPVLARKPGALRNGAPFKDWVLPANLARVRRKLAGSDDGDRQMVKILAAVLSDGLPAVEAACAEALAQGVHSADVIINILARRREPPPAPMIHTPEALKLRHAPIADCARYDQLRRTAYGTDPDLRADERTQALWNEGCLTMRSWRRASSASMSRRTSSAISCKPRSAKNKPARSNTKSGSPSSPWQRTSTTSSSKARRSTSASCAISRKATFLPSSATACWPVDPIPIHDAHLAMSLENKGVLIRIFS